MMENVDLGLENQWQAKPGEEIKIPEAYIRELNFEIHVFSLKREFAFRCKDFKAKRNSRWLFDGVILDTSKRDPQGNITLNRFTHYPVVSLVNIGFMVIPAPEGEAES